MKVILSFYRNDEGSAFEQHRGRVKFDIEKHNSMEIACKHVIEFMGIKQQAEKFGLGGFDLKLFRLEKIDGKAENFAIVTKAQLEMELPFLMGSASSVLSILRRSRSFAAFVTRSLPSPTGKGESACQKPRTTWTV